MKPAELFPGAVVMKDGVPIELSAVSNLWITVGPGTMTLAHHIDEFMPLPISPAVLRGLGIPEYELMTGGTDRSTWRIGGQVIRHAHQLQAISLHLHGVELTWNQSEYEQAVKEEAK